MSRSPAPSPVDWYRLGAGDLGIRTDDPAFRRRVRRLYTDCAVAAPGQGPRVECSSRHQDEQIAVTLEEPAPPIDLSDFALAVFPAQGYAGTPGPGPGEGTLRGGPAGTVWVSGRTMIFERGRPWPRFAGNLAVNLVLYRQTGTVFFHAAAVALGSGAVLLLGPKGAGKTTLSLALAARGHAFLGDETAGIEIASRRVVAVHRTTAIRPGPAAGAIERRLRQTRFPRERFPDGTVRVRAPGTALFGADGAQASHPLRGILFLRGFAPGPVLEPLSMGRDHLALLTPLACSLWGAAPGRRAMELATLAATVPCYSLTLGAPDDTAHAVEITLEA